MIDYIVFESLQSDLRAHAFMALFSGPCCLFPQGSSLLYHLFPPFSELPVFPGIAHKYIHVSHVPGSFLLFMARHLKGMNEALFSVIAYPLFIILLKQKSPMSILPNIIEYFKSLSYLTFLWHLISWITSSKFLPCLPWHQILFLYPLVFWLLFLNIFFYRILFFRSF